MPRNYFIHFVWHYLFKYCSNREIKCAKLSSNVSSSFKATRAMPAQSVTVKDDIIIVIIV